MQNCAMQTLYRAIYWRAVRYCAICKKAISYLVTCKIEISCRTVVLLQGREMSSGLHTRKLIPEILCFRIIILSEYQ